MARFKKKFLLAIQMPYVFPFLIVFLFFLKNNCFFFPFFTIFFSPIPHCSHNLSTVPFILTHANSTPLFTDFNSNFSICHMCIQQFIIRLCHDPKIFVFKLALDTILSAIIIFSPPHFFSLYHLSVQFIFEFKPFFSHGIQKSN